MKASRPLLIALTATLALAPSISRAERTPPGAFLRYRVQSAADASRQVVEDKTVAARYSEFYKSSPRQVSDAFADFRLVQLSKEWHGRVYFLGRGNRVISEMRTLNKGRWVYVDWKNNPVLDAACGNPLTTSLPRKPRQVLAPPATSNPLLLTAQGGDLLSMATAPAPVFAMDLAPLSILPETQVASIEPLILASRGVSPLPFLVPLLFGGGGGGGNHNDNPPPPVPEPASIVMAGMGLAGAFRLRRRTR
ncbi:MAG: PEP-CTERM sorting domain-containing protein [Armatimonadetes bacterium]|nr:PEP-CTERM sorting domain-containing protein [Armatimonadota bacterium]